MDYRPDESCVSFVLMDVLQAERQLAPLRVFWEQDAGLMRQALQEAAVFVRSRRVCRRPPN
jgi:hypothetical protein